MALATLETPQGGGKVLSVALAFAFGHVLLQGLILGIAEDLVAKAPKRWMRVAITAAVALGASFVILDDDFHVFVWPIRVALFVAAAAPFPAIVASKPWVSSRRWAGAAAIVVGVLIAVVNPVALEVGYAGIHLLATTLAGAVITVGLSGLLGPRARAWRPRARAIPTAIACVMAAASAAIWPSNQVLIALSQIPTATQLGWLTRLREVARSGSTGNVPAAQLEWFENRDGRAAIPPTKPALTDKQPIVVLITVDALRADVVADKKNKQSAGLRKMAGTGTYFTQARSIASATSPAVAGLFTGKYFSSLYWTERTLDNKLKFFLADDESIRFPELLAQRGVATMASVSTTGFKAEYGLTKGFDDFISAGGYSRKIEPKIEEWLESLGDKPGFLWAHWLDPHYPYDQGGKKGAAFKRYLAEVGIVDDNIERLTKFIQDKGLADRTYLIVAADHGEAFGEHNTKTHATSVYEEQIRIPIVVVGPGIKKQEVDAPVSLIDLGPTVLDIFQIDTPGHFMGQSLVRLLQGKKATLTRPIAADTGRRKQAMVFPDGYKVIRDVRRGTVELYDLSKDPEEKTNLADEMPEETTNRLGTLSQFFDTHEMKRPGYTTPYRD